GMKRVNVEGESFAGWLRHLPLRAAGSAVHAFDGSVVLEGNDSRVAAVATLDVPPRDLQQCADSILRFDGEWPWARGRPRDSQYRLTSGDLASFAAYANGERPEVVDGKRVRFVPKAVRDESHASFDRFLEMVMQYAGTVSLAAYSPKVDRADLRPG